MLIAAGGICNGRGMAAAFALGVEGIQMGTRFVSAAESPVHANYKQAIVDADDTGTVMLNRKSHPLLSSYGVKTLHGAGDDDGHRQHLVDQPDGLASERQRGLHVATEIDVLHAGTERAKEIDRQGEF